RPAGARSYTCVPPPLNTTDYSSFVRHLPPPNQVDGYFWVVGGSGTVPSLKAFQQAYGPLSAKKVIGNLFFAVTGNFQQVAPQVSGENTGGVGTPSEQQKSKETVKEARKTEDKHRETTPPRTT